MNYRHAFHAGNFADVLKHSVLALALKLLTAKPKPLRVIDTHAGVGRYELGGNEAQRTGEWRSGIGRLLGPSARQLPAEMEILLRPYLDVVRAANETGRLDTYPGSPQLTLALLRPDDRLIANELHPQDAASLRSRLQGDPRAKVMSRDGWEVLRASLPPRERRGLVLIDPPFEEARELDRLVNGLSEGVRRFATGTYLLWLPVKDAGQVARFRRSLQDLGLERLHWLELQTEATNIADRLVATALVMLNPPFGLHRQLERLMPFLAEWLATGPGSGWKLEAIETRPISRKH